MPELGKAVYRLLVDNRGFIVGLAEAEQASSRATSRIGKQLTSIGKSTEALGKSMTRHITLPIVALGAASTKMSMDFGKNMALIQSSAGGTAKDVKVLSSAVLELAKHSQYGPEQLAKAMYHLKSLGYDNATAMNVLKVAVKGATAGQADLEATTSALGGAIRTTIKGTGDYKQAQATLNAIVGAGNMRMDDLTSALGTGLLPAAKTAGISLRDVGAALATMTDENVPANAAATRLRMTFALMGAPSREAEKQLNKIGLSGTQLSMAMNGPRGLIGALEMLKSHLGSAGDAAAKKLAGDFKTGKISLQEFEKEIAHTATGQILTKAFGGGRTAGAIELLLNNMEFVKRKYVQIGETAKNFDKNVAAQEKTALFQLKQAWSNIEVAMIKAGNAIAPVVVKMARGLALIADKFSGLSDNSRRWILISLGVAALVGPFLRITGLVIKLGGAVMTLAGKWTTTFSVARTQMVETEATSTGMFATIRAGAIATATVLRGVLISFGIGAVMIAFSLAATWAITHWDTVKKWFKKFLGWMEYGFKATWDAIKLAGKTVVYGILEYVTAGIRGVLKVASYLPFGVGKKAKAALQGINDYVNQFKPDVGKAFANLGNNAGEEYYDAVHPWLDQVTQDTLTSMQLLTSAGTQAAKGDAKAAAQAGGTMFGLQTKAKQLGAGSGGVYVTGGGHGGVAKPGAALDCSGYVYQVFTQNGFESFPGTSETQWSTMNGPNWFSEVIPPAKATVGDVVFMVGSPKYPSPGHVGIITDGSGAGATMMEYFQSGRPAGTRKLGQVNDLVGVKRFYIGKKTGKTTKTPKPNTKKPLTVEQQLAALGLGQNIDTSGLPSPIIPDGAGKKKAKVHYAKAAAVRSAKDALGDISKEVAKYGTQAQKNTFAAIQKGLGTDKLTTDQLAMLRVKMRELTKAIKKEIPKLAKQSAIEMAKINLTDIQDEAKVYGSKAQQKQLATLMKMLGGKKVTTSELATIKTKMSALKKAIDDEMNRKETSNDLSKMLGPVAALNDPKTSALLNRLQQMLKDKVISPAAISYIKQRMQDIKDAISGGIDKAQSVVDGAKNGFDTSWSRLTGDIGQLWDAQTKGIIDKIQVTVKSMTGAFSEFKYMNGGLTPTEQKIKDLQDAHDQTQAERDLADAKQAVADAEKKKVDAATTLQGKQAALAALQGQDVDTDTLTQAQQDVTDAQQSYDDAAASITDTNQSLQDTLYQQNIDTLQKQADLERTAADKQLQDAQDTAQRDRDIKKNAMDQELSDLQKNITDGLVTNDQASSQLKDILGKYGVATADAATLLGDTFSLEFTDAMGKATDSINSLITALNQLIKLQGGAPIGDESNSTTDSGGGGGSGASFSWGGKTWHAGDKAAFVRYLASTGIAYATWAANHPSAAAVFGDAPTSPVRGSHGALPQAKGSYGVVTKPTLFLAGEAGPEPFWFGGAKGETPMPGGSKTIIVNQDFKSSPDNQFLAMRRAKFAAEGVFG